MVGGGLTITGVELWEDGGVQSSAYWPFDGASALPDLSPVIPQQRFFTFDYLQMLRRLFPKGYIWRFPIGEPDDYD